MGIFISFTVETAARSFSPGGLGSDIRYSWAMVPVRLNAVALERSPAVRAPVDRQKEQTETMLEAH